MLTLVLLPGMDGTGALFEPLVAALNGEFGIETVSYRPTGAQDYAELERQARAALPRQGRFVLLGESFSGPVAVALAASRPPGLAGLMLCSTFARNPWPACTPLRWLTPALPLANAPPALLNALLLGRFSSPALRAALARAIAQTPARTLRARLRAVLSVDVSASLQRVGVPVLYLRATRDRVVPMGASRHIQRLLPAAEVVPVEAPHFLLQAAPVEAARTIRRFMRTLEDAR